MFYKLLRKTKLGKILYKFYKNNEKFNEPFLYDERKAKKIKETYSLSFCEEKNNNHAFDLDIIVPCYNVVNTVEKCLKSIMNSILKSKYNCRIIIVNDGSTDDTLEIINKTIHSFNNCLVINQKNRGLSGARNAGLDCLDSDYVMFVDSDDTISENCISLMLKSAKDNESDVVVGNYVVSTSFIKNKIKFNHSVEKIPGFAWGKIYKSELWKDIRFYEGLWFEDTIIQTIVLKLTRSISYIDEFVYYYKRNLKGISHSAKGNDKSLDSMIVYYLSLLEMNYKNIEISTQDGYEYFLYHCHLTCVRMINCSNDAKEKAFTFMKYIYNNFFESFETKQNNNKEIEYCIKNDKKRLIFLYAKLD